MPLDLDMGGQSRLSEQPVTPEIGEVSKHPQFEVVDIGVVKRVRIWRREHCEIYISRVFDELFAITSKNFEAHTGTVRKSVNVHDCGVTRINEREPDL